MNLYEKLSNVQQKLSVPKNQYNEFGKYKYRSCEDIVESAKPLLAGEGLVMTITDEIVVIGDRHYVKATVTIYDPAEDAEHSVQGFAREEENKKGMDSMQLTGATSSYARKYALNGMFAIDDAKDADSTNKHNRGKKTNPKKAPKKTSGRQKEIKKTVGDNEEMQNMVREYLAEEKPDNVKKSDFGVDKLSNQKYKILLDTLKNMEPDDIDLNEDDIEVPF